MLRPLVNIQIGDFVFDYVHELEVESGWDTLTDTCTIKLPRKLAFNGKSVKDLLRVGDAVTVECGYNEKTMTTFQGYVARISPNIPIVIECEDAMWLLKRNNVTVSLQKASLATVLAAVLPAGFAMGEVDSFVIGNFRATKVSAAKVLEFLRKEYGVVSYIKNGKLFSGLAYRFSGIGEDVEIHLQSDVAGNSNLEYKLADDLKLKLQAISLMPDNTKIEVELGDPDGEQRTLHYYNLSEKSLRQAAEADFVRLKHDGYTGSVSIFGGKAAEHGGVSQLTDAEFPERSGRYLIDKVRTAFGMGGYRQEISLGKKATA